MKNYAGSISVGVILGFCGTILVVRKSGGLGFDSRYSLGYCAAVCSAVVWASYSLLARRFHRIPTLLVGGFCFISAILSLICHFLFGEANIFPPGLPQWSAMIALGLFPVGLAFYCWDYGIKNGNIQVLGATSYAPPPLIHTPFGTFWHYRAKLENFGGLHSYYLRCGFCFKRYNFSKTNHQKTIGYLFTKMCIGFLQRAY